MAQLEGFIFDMDGLMIDSERIAYKAWSGAAKALGSDLGEEVYRKLIGRRSADSRQLLREIFGNGLDLDALNHEVDRRYDAAIARELPVKAGLFELLTLLEEKNIPRVVATSTRRVKTDKKLAKIGATGRFQATVCGDEIEHGKPAPDIYLKAAEKMHADPARCVVLEDSIAGLKGARAAGAIVIWIPDMIPPTDETRELPHAIATSLHDVARMVAENHLPGGLSVC